MQDVLKKINNDLLAEIKAIEKLNKVAELKKRRERADSISRACTIYIIDIIHDAKESGLNNTQIASATGYSTSYIKELMKRRRLGFTDQTGSTRTSV